MGRAGWVVAAGLLVAVIGLAVALRLAGSRPRFAPDGGLLAELSEVELIDEPPPPAEAWPQWRGPARDGAVSFPKLKADWSGLRAAHKWSVGEGYSSFAVRGDRAWTMGQADGEENVMCLDLATGEEAWRHPYAPRVTFDYGGPRSTPAVDADELFTVSSDGVVMCLNAATGAEVWKTPLEAASPRWGFAASPLIDGGRVYAGPAAFDRGSGKKLWEKSREVVGYSSPVLTTVGDTRVLICFTGNALLGLSPDDGAELWRFAWPTFSNVNAATPLVIRAKKGTHDFTYVFISSGYEKGCALVKVAKEGPAFRAAAVYESNELCCHFASPVRRGGFIYGLDEARDLTCLDLRSGGVKWRRRGFRKGSLIRVDDRLLLLGENGNLALVEASPEEYVEVTAAKPFRDRCWAAPALAGGRLVIRDRKTAQVMDVGE